MVHSDYFLGHLKKRHDVQLNFSEKNSNLLWQLSWSHSLTNFISTVHLLSSESRQRSIATKLGKWICKLSGKCLPERHTCPLLSPSQVKLLCFFAISSGYKKSPTHSVTHLTTHARQKLSSSAENLRQGKRRWDSMQERILRYQEFFWVPQCKK